MLISWHLLLMVLCIAGMGESKKKSNMLLVEVEDKEAGRGADYSDGPWAPGHAPTTPAQLTFMRTAPPEPDPIYYYKPEPKFIYNATPEPEPKYYHNPQPRPPPTWAPERKVIYHAKPERDPKYYYNPK